MIGKLFIHVCVTPEEFGKPKKLTLASIYCDRDEAAEKLADFKTLNPHIKPQAMFAIFVFQESVNTR
jgi:hypothetical protein